MTAILPNIFLILSLLLSPLPEREKAMVAKETTKAISVLSTERCHNWLLSIGSNPEELGKVIASTQFYDAKKSKIPLRYSGILNGKLRTNLPMWVWAKEYKFGLVQASLNNHMVIYANDYRLLKYEHIIHESLHFYFEDYDIDLAQRMGIKIHGRNTMPISDEVRKHCK